MTFREQPKSVQADRRTGYRERLSRRALARFAGAMLAGPLYSRVVWIHGVPVTGDVDNISKPIIDALKGVVYRDDFAVVKRSVERFEKADPALAIQPGDTAGDLLGELIDFLAGDDPHLVYVEVGELRSRRLVFGPIDAVRDAGGGSL